MEGCRPRQRWQRSDELGSRSARVKGSAQALRLPQKSTDKADSGSSLAQVVVAPEEVEHGEVNTPQVVLRERFEGRQIPSERAQSVHHSLEDIAFRWWWRRSSKERVQ